MFLSSHKRNAKLNSRLSREAAARHGWFPLLEDDFVPYFGQSHAPSLTVTTRDLQGESGRQMKQKSHPKFRLKMAPAG